MEKQLKQWRQQHGLSIEAAARLVGVTASTWWRWEMGRTRPMGLSRAALERVMQTTVSGEQLNER